VKGTGFFVDCGFATYSAVLLSVFVAAATQSPFAVSQSLRLLAV
jgi:hypothetical protein